MPEQEKSQQELNGDNMSQEGIINVRNENSGSFVPYERVLAKAFDKLTSEILIFLLAYTILLIGLLYFGINIPDTWRNFFYLIPVIGVLAYIWLQQGGIHKYANQGFCLWQVAPRHGYPHGKFLLTGVAVQKRLQ